ncbi:MAG: hypothetical protein HFH20_02405 [Ruminococcus sp.]|jgi:hypothetical protein|nr:hypothetical protein [uncultured Schaedlerella sp.]MCI9152617.1 hypothetical protein [Ruminococcus sp.]
MSKINAARLININYNNNAIRVSDETFHFNGESTLISLRNGGGKSVLVQMLTAPFVHKRYRDAKDRPFESYFTTGKPSFILVEWALDQNAGFVLTGMMVRRSQDSDSGEDLEMVNFICEYRSSCLQDIHHLPVVEKGKKEMTLKNFSACRQLFEGYKRDRSLQFFYYDMNNGAQSRQYFDKLQEYQIHYKEWESIIKKVNMKESGLSELFSDCRDEKGLVEKWFLDAVESKLNKERNRMKEFQSILEKYVGQYKDNRSKIQRRDTIRMYKQEAQKIREKLSVYREGEQKEEEQENLVAHFIAELERLQAVTKEGHEEVLSQMEEVLAEIAHIEYEKLSGEIYQLEEQMRFHLSSRDMLSMEKEALERETEEIIRRLHVLACAKQQRLADEEKAEWDEALQRLRVAQEKNVNLEPERNRLGYVLRRHYEKELEENGKRQQENSLAIAETEENISREKQIQSNLEEQIRERVSAEGALKSQVQAYDRQEEQFNNRHQEQFVRNILGEYEPGTMEIFQEAQENRMEELVRERLKTKKAQEASKETQRSQERKLADMREEQIRRRAEQGQQEGIRSSYEEELEERKVILKYLDLDEKELFDREKILQASGRKLLETANLRRNLEKEEDGLQKEYQRLTKGQVLELPQELEAELTGLGIHVVYGMEWLKKNGYPEKANQELVRSHPFLPYGLILSKQEVEKLSRHTGNICTSFPIPIILREHLEKRDREEPGNIRRFEDVSFYVLFNENLLNEEKLRELVAEKERQIARKREAIRIRQEEYQQYFERQEQVKNQSVSRESYEENEKRLKELADQIQGTDEDIRTASQKLAELKEQIELREQDIRRADQELERQRRKAEDFQELRAVYEEYVRFRQELELCRKDMGRLADKQKLSREKLEKLQERQKSLETERDALLREEEEQQEAVRKYRRYEEYTELKEKEAGEDWRGLWAAAKSGGAAAAGGRQEQKSRSGAADGAAGGQQEQKSRSGAADGAAVKPRAEKSAVQIRVDLRKIVSDMEARYAAVTATVSLEIQELERQEQLSGRRCKEADQELKHLQKKYGLTDDAWQETYYNRKEESRQEVLLEDRRLKIRTKQSLWNEEDKRIAVLTQQKEDILKRMRTECGQEEPLPKSEIQNQDFESRKNQLKYQEKELKNTADKLQKRLHSLDENLTALAEYSEFEKKEPVAWEQDFIEMNAKELRNFKGILIRDYNQCLKSRQDAKEQLVRVLNQIVRDAHFQEDYYKKPLEAMLELAGDAGQVQRQLETTIQSYDSLMEKLEVDISVVEKEKQKIAELLEDYLQEVHRNLGRIDQNSTITVRERAIKMLKIQLPAWEENENLYHIRLQDLIDELTEKGIGIFERNENAQEYFGTRMTTRNLYDTVVGIGNVQIRLYKIEAQREYPITWAEVAKNSGGEGFLSAFVILSSLLYYMRKDETDIFADRNEGKVLLMDNPFAQTNASHLLKPLMDVAKKTNTQLICLTGLGGDSIYNRFDNIYVLNLIAASLRSGMQYLRANHLRGNEPETMVVSQIEVMEQQELVF